jgi:hypothetical protein
VSLEYRVTKIAKPSIGNVIDRRSRETHLNRLPGAGRNSNFSTAGRSMEMGSCGSVRFESEAHAVTANLGSRLREG